MDTPYLPRTDEKEACWKFHPKLGCAAIGFCGVRIYSIKDKKRSSCWCCLSLCSFKNEISTFLDQHSKFHSLYSGYFGYFFYVVFWYNLLSHALVQTAFVRCCGYRFIKGTFTSGVATVGASWSTRLNWELSMDLTTSNNFLSKESYSFLSWKCFTSEVVLIFKAFLLDSIKVFALDATLLLNLIEI